MNCRLAMPLAIYPVRLGLRPLQEGQNITPESVGLALVTLVVTQKCGRYWRHSGHGDDIVNRSLLTQSGEFAVNRHPSSMRTAGRQGSRSSGRSLLKIG
jgi:hypothetical protein